MAVVSEACGKAFLWFVVRPCLQGLVFVAPPFFRLLVKMSWFMFGRCSPGSSVVRCSIPEFHSYREMDCVNTRFYCISRHFGASDSCYHFAEQTAAEGLAKLNFLNGFCAAICSISLGIWIIQHISSLLDLFFFFWWNFCWSPLKLHQSLGNGKKSQCNDLLWK